MLLYVDVTKSSCGGQHGSCLLKKPPNMNTHVQSCPLGCGWDLCLLFIHRIYKGKRDVTSEFTLDKTTWFSGACAWPAGVGIHLRSYNHLEMNSANNLSKLFNIFFPRKASLGGYSPANILPCCKVLSRGLSKGVPGLLTQRSATWLTCTVLNCWFCSYLLYNDRYITHVGTLGRVS